MRIFALFFVFIINFQGSFAQNISTASSQIVGYIPQRSIHKMTSATFLHLNHAIYFGLDVDGNGNLQIDKVERSLIILDSLRADKPVHLSVCFGGWGRSDFFVEMTASMEKRQNFCEQVLQMCQKYHINGVDVDWEFPHEKSQQEGFVQLIKDLHKTLSPHDLDITVAVGFWRKQARLVASVEPFISRVNLMLYDNYSPFKGQASYTLVKRSCNRFMRMGIPSEKLLIGVPFYGRHRWKHKRTMAYHDVEHPEESISRKGVYKGYFFDVPATLNRKIEYIKNTNKGGIMIWELGQDLDTEKDDSLLRYISERMKGM